MIAIIESDNIKLGRIEKNIRDTSVKLSFLAAEKEYIFNFLDYERMTLLNGKDSHDKLMEDACEKFNQDIEQIENLYELIHKETLNKATKKMYKEKYNVDYLQKIEDKERNFEDELTNSRIKKTSVINSNFWRIEGIKNVYYLFRKEVTEKYERDLSEFDIREEKRENMAEQLQSSYTHPKSRRTITKVALHMGWGKTSAPRSEEVGLGKVNHSLIKTHLQALTN